MAGILDPKKRIIDALITVDGRRQMAARTIDISFATFSDEGLFYDSEDGTSARDISNLPIFEVASLPRDVIIPEVDDDGAFSMNLSDGNKVVNGRKVISGALDTISVDENGARTVVKVDQVLTGAINVYSGTLDVLTSAKKHFDQLNILRTDDGIVDSGFDVSANNLFLETEEREIGLKVLRPLVFDDSINHIINTKYLPPEVSTDTGEDMPLGNFPRFNKPPYNNYKTFEEKELLTAISSETVDFNSTGNSNNLLGQFFEVGSDGTQKLAIVDYGEFIDENSVIHRVFYLGKPIRDPNGTMKFCRLFTLVFEQ
tara:strand:+ start:576 stop:1517 length:942 start_codon:yes stop_codon:yes gene_type:complete